LLLRSYLNFLENPALPIGGNRELETVQDDPEVVHQQARTVNTTLMLLEIA